MDDSRRWVEEGRQLAGQHRWGPAAGKFADAAARALEDGDRAFAKEALEAAGESWRRDDNPGAAARALQAALDLTQDDSRVLAMVRLAGVLGELGQAPRAQALCQQAAGAVGSGPLRWIVLDTWIGSLQAQGRKEDARPLVTELERAQGGPQEIAACFRRGQLQRLDGELVEAAARFVVVAGQLEGVAGAESGLAAAQAELGEVALLRGDTGDALRLYQVAWEAHDAAGRRSMAWRAAAGRTRVALAHGLSPLTGELSAGIAHAEERDMRLLEADLRLARAMAAAQDDPDGATRDFDRAVALADASGDRLRSGRARLERASWLDVETALSVEELGRARTELEPNRPWWARARLALGLARVSAGDAAARREIVGALAHFEDMGMARDARIARRWLQRIG